MNAMMREKANLSHKSDVHVSYEMCSKGPNAESFEMQTFSHISMLSFESKMASASGYLALIPQEEVDVIKWLLSGTCQQTEKPRKSNFSNTV